MTIIEFEPQKAGRKKLAHAIAEHFGTDVAYAGTPSFAYQIGEASLDRDWTLHLPDDTDTDAVAEAARRAGFTAAGAGDVGLTVTMPVTGWTERTRANLEALLASKGELIARALDIPATPVEFEGDVVAFPWFTTMPSQDVREVVIQLIVALCERAETASRTSSKPPKPGNDKYTMRCFLLALGFIGPEYKKLRRILLAGLDGDAAWRTPKPGGRPIGASLGQRVRLIGTSDPYTRLRPGEEGTVAFIDDAGTVHINWDSGSQLGLIPGEDDWETLSPQAAKDS